MDTSVRIRAIGLPQRDLLAAMYDRYEPLGAAFGLPPWTANARRDWIGLALGHKMNLAAFSSSGAVIGHCFLAAGEAGSAELAMFVHQDFRGRGVGTALLKAALDWGFTEGLRRVWSLTSSDNRPALRMQAKCGFRPAHSAFPEIEMEIHLPAPMAADPPAAA